MSEATENDSKPVLLVVSGLSGSGKSVALKTFEDLGFYCVDNLPAELLGSFVRSVTGGDNAPRKRSEEHTSELQSLMRISYAVFCLKKKKRIHTQKNDRAHNT